MPVQQHVYQKTHNGEIIFYSSRDAIVFFTTFCAVARKHGVAPVALCIMPEHLHGLYKADCRGDLSPFIKEYSRIFTLQFNKDISRRGSLFKPRFGCAAKAGSKSIRTINAYIANNPVEKRSCLRAEEYRWNFLAYAVSDHPFSDKLIIRKAGSNMKKAVRVVDYLRNRYQPIGYKIYDRISERLGIVEKMQLIDYIISSYNVLDYTALLSCYKSYEGMLEAFANTKGAEYDLKEDFDSYSNLNYSRIALFLKEEYGIEKPKDVLRLPYERRLLLAGILTQRRLAPEFQVRKYLHLFDGGDMLAFSAKD